MMTMRPRGQRAPSDSALGPTYSALQYSSDILVVHSASTHSATPSTVRMTPFCTIQAMKSGLPVATAPR